VVDYQAILEPYNPWWHKNKDSNLLRSLPSFQRPIFKTLYDDLKTIPQIISVIGPRRIGKSTLLMQVIKRLIEEGVRPQNLIYYSFDDPALIIRRVKIEELLDQMIKKAVAATKYRPLYLFLDEIQKLDRWELYLKKYYDLKYPVRLMISGSASSPIFKKSRESLLGRVKDYHLLPFSFKEYVMFNLQKQPSLFSEVENLANQGQIMQRMAADDPAINSKSVFLKVPSTSLKTNLDMQMKKYMLEGGFPEVWTLPTWQAKQEYLYDNQVKKVIYEDLILATEFRKPELLKRFYISLLERPGMEINLSSVAKETGVKVAQIDKYLPLLEMTDLVYRLEKFRANPVRVRKGMMKFYLIDLALRNAVLRLDENLLRDEGKIGLYAENFVFLALKKWQGTIQLDYYRERQGEVDFIVHVSPGTYLPIEVKYRNAVTKNDIISIKKFCYKYRVENPPILVTKNWNDFGRLDIAFRIPLPLFLLLFDRQ
jgi:predicted AAA+ superfamily ATPase